MKVLIEDAKNNFTPYRVVIEVESQEDQDALVRLSSDPGRMASEAAVLTMATGAQEGAVRQLLETLHETVKRK